MKKFLTLILFPVLLLGITACEVSEIDKKLDMAVSAIEDDDYEKAQVICDKVMRNHWSELSHEQKCDLAMFYTVLYNELDTNEDANIAALKKCYKAAMKENPKETRKYFNEVDEDIHDAIKLLIEMDDIGDELEDMVQDWDF